MLNFAILCDIIWITWERYTKSSIGGRHEGYDLSKQVIKERNYNNIDVIIGDLNDGLAIARHAVDLGTTSKTS